MTPLNTSSSRYSSAGSSCYAETDVSGGSAARSAMRDRAKRWISNSKANQNFRSSTSVYIDDNNDENLENKLPVSNNAKMNRTDAFRLKFDLESPTAELSDTAIESSLQAWDEIAKDETMPHTAAQHIPLDLAVKTARLRRGSTTQNNQNIADNSNSIKANNVLRSLPSSTQISKVEPGNFNDLLMKGGNKKVVSNSSAAIESSLQAWDEIAQDESAPHTTAQHTPLFDLALQTARRRRGNNTKIERNGADKTNYTDNVSNVSNFKAQSANLSDPLEGKSKQPAATYGGRISKIAEVYARRATRTPSPACPSDEGESTVSSPLLLKKTLSPVSPFSPPEFNSFSSDWLGDASCQILASSSMDEEINKRVASWIDRDDSDVASSTNTAEVDVFAKSKKGSSKVASNTMLPMTQLASSSNAASQQHATGQQSRRNSGMKSRLSAADTAKKALSPPTTVLSAFVNGKFASKQRNDEVTVSRRQTTPVSAKYQQAIADSCRPKSPVKIVPRAIITSSTSTPGARSPPNQPINKILPQASLKDNISSEKSKLNFTSEKSLDTITHRPLPVKPVLRTDTNQNLVKKNEAHWAPKTATGETVKGRKTKNTSPQVPQMSATIAPSSLHKQSLLPIMHESSAFKSPKKHSESKKSSSDLPQIPDGIDLSASAQRYYATTGRNIGALEFSSPPSLSRTTGVVESTNAAEPQPLSEEALSLQNLYSPMRRQINGVAVPGYDGFIHKTADIPNLIDQCSVASGATGALEDMRVTSSWTLNQKGSQISEDRSDIFDGLSSNGSDDAESLAGSDKLIDDTGKSTADSIQSDPTQSYLDLSKYYIEPDIARQLVQHYRKMFRKRKKHDEDYKKAFALFEMRSRVMETDIERGLPRQGGTIHTDDIVLTSTNLATIRVRDAAIVAKAWRDGASPKDIVTASLLTRRSTHCYFIQRPMYTYNTTTGEETQAGCFFEEVRWLDDSDLSLIRCASLQPMPVRGFDIFTLGDCHSLLLKLTNERCVQLHNELEAAYELQLEAEHKIERVGRSGAIDERIKADIEMTFLSSLQEVSEISIKLELAEKAFGMVQGGIAKLIAKYEALLVGMNRSNSFDSDAEDEDEALAARAMEAERKIKAAEEEALKAKEEAERIRRIKDSEVQSLKSRVEELERQTALERERSNDLMKQYELKIENLERQSAVGLDSRSMFQNSVYSTHGSEKVESVKQKFRSRHFERLNKTHLSTKRSPAAAKVSVKALSAQFERSSKPSPSLIGMSEEEMFQHLDFYERIVKAGTLKTR